MFSAFANSMMWGKARLSPAPDDDFWYSPVSGKGKIPGLPAVNYLTAISCVAVNACTRRIADTVASLPIHVYERLEDGGKRLAPDHPNYSLLHGSTSEEMTAVEWKTQMMEDLLIPGNHVSRVMLGGKQTVREIIPLDPSEVEIKRNRETGIRYFEYTPEGRTTPEILLDDEVLFIPGPWMKGGKARSPIDLVAESIGLTMSSQEYGARFFAQGASPRMFGTTPSALNEKAREQLHEYINKKIGGLKNAHKVPAFDNGFELKSIQVNHRDLQFLELRRFQLEEVARIYNVPLHMIQNLERATFSNIEHQDIEFAKHTIRPWLTRLEARINRTLFGPREGQRYFAEFNMDALFRGDAKSRAEFYASMIQNACMTPNEVRAKENMNPMEGGDKLLIQGATIPLEMAGKPQEVPQNA